MDNKTISNDVDLSTIVDITPSKANIILDTTVLTSLMSCPRMSDLKFNNNLISISGKSNSLEVGSVVHKFLEVYYGSRINGLSISQSQGFGLTAAELYIQGCPHCTEFSPIHDIRHNTENGHICGEFCLLKPSCGHRPNDYPGVYNTPKENETHLIGWHWALDTCEQYVAYYKNDFWVPKEVEKVHGKVLYEDDEVRILWKAKLDIVFDTLNALLPTDHKTMKQNRDSDSLNNQFIGQCLVMGTQNMVVNKIGFQKTLPPEEKFKRDMLSYSTDRLIEWQGTILPYYAKLLLMYSQSGYYPPNYTSCDGKYGKCSFHEVCKANMDDRERVLREQFRVGLEWNPVNEDE